MSSAARRRSGFGGQLRLLARLREVPAAAEKMFLGGALQTFGRVVEDTPVDTGFARASWRPEVERRPDLLAVMFFNGAAYIIYLEKGWSKQAPNGMVAKNLERFRQDWELVSREIFGGGR